MYLWEIYVSVNDEEYYTKMIVRANEVKKGDTELYNDELYYSVVVDGHYLFFDEPIVEINRVENS